MNVFQFVFGGRKWMKATSYSSKLSSFFVDSYNHPGKEHHSDHLIITDYPSKIRQPKKSIRRTNTFQTKSWILAIYIYIPYFGINRFPDLWILAIYIAPYFHHPQIAPNIRPCWGDFHSEHQTAEARRVWPGSGFNGKQELLKMGILCILNAFCTSWYDPISKKYKLYYQDMKELQSYQKVEIHPS